MREAAVCDMKVWVASVGVLLVVLYGCEPADRSPKRLVVDDRVIDGNDFSVVIDPVWWSVSIYDGRKKYDDDLTRFSKEQRYAFAIWWYVAEVNNGGHHQFFFNSTGIVWADAADGFRQTGLTPFALVAEQAGRMLGARPSEDRMERQRQMDRAKPDFEEVDAEFHKLQSRIDVGKALLNYARAHRRSFYFSGEVLVPK